MNLSHRTCQLDRRRTMQSAMQSLFNYQHRIGFELTVLSQNVAHFIQYIHTCTSDYNNGSFLLVTGAIYEATQRWESVYYYISACCIAAGLLVFITSLTLRFKSKCSQKNKHAESEDVAQFIHVCKAEFLQLLFNSQIAFTLQDENIHVVHSATWPRMVKFTELNISKL